MEIKLQDLAGGALQENAAKAIEEVVKNMRDDKYDGVECALFEADGGAWKNVDVTNQ